METADPFDVAIVLGARVRPDGTPSAALERRVRHAVGLAEAGAVRHLLLTGGPVAHPTPEAQAMRDLALALGLPAERLTVEDCARNTIQNALLSAPILERHGWGKAVLVTETWHLPRALYVFRRLGLAVTGSGAGAGPGWWLAALREVGALPWTMIRVETACPRRIV